MRRQQYYQPQQQYADPGIVDFGQIQMYNPQDTANLVQAGQAMQQRWDTAQSNIAKYWEDLGAANLGRYRPDVEKAMTDRFNDMEKSIQEDYQGDYGRAANTVIKSLSKDRALMHQGTQAAALEKEARNKYEQMLAAGKAPQYLTIDEITRQPVMKQYDFDKWHKEKVGDGYIGGVKDGKFNMPQFAELRGASDLTSYLDKNISKALNDESTYSELKQNNNVMGMLMRTIIEGKTDPEIDALFEDEKDVKALAMQLRSEPDFFGAEAENMTDAQIVQYAIPIIKGQVARKVKPKDMQDPAYDPKKGNNNPSDPYYGLYTKRSVEDKAKVEKKRNELKTLISSIDNPSILIASSDRSNAPLSPNVLPSFGDTEQDLAIAKGKRTQEIDKYKKNYNSIWNYINSTTPNVLNPIEKDRMFLQHLIKLDLPANLAKENNLIISPTDNEIFNDLKTGLQRQMSNSTLYSGEDKVKGADIFGEGGKNIKNIEFVPVKGNIVFSIKNDASSTGVKEYSLKDKDMANLPDELKLTLQTVEELYKGKFNYELDTDIIESPIYVNMDVQGINIPVKPVFTWITNPETGVKTFTKKYKTIVNGEEDYITENDKPLEEYVNEFQDIINPFFARIAAAQGVNQ